MKLFILYARDAWLGAYWYEVWGVFTSEGAVRSYARKKRIKLGSGVYKPSKKNVVTLPKRENRIIVETEDGEIPEVEVKGEPQD